VEGPQAVRHHVRIGERLPLDKTVIAAANALSYELAGSVTGETQGVVSTWHP